MFDDNISKKTAVIISVICIITITLSGVLLLRLENKNNSVIMKADTFAEENEELYNKYLEKTIQKGKKGGLKITRKEENK